MPAADTTFYARRSILVTGHNLAQDIFSKNATQARCDHRAHCGSSRKTRTNDSLRAIPGEQKIRDAWKRLPERFYFQSPPNPDVLQVFSESGLL